MEIEDYVGGCLGADIFLRVEVVSVDRKGVERGRLFFLIKGRLEGVNIG